MTTRKKLLTQDEAGEYLGVSPRSLAKARCIGYPNIPFIKIGRTVRYNEDDLGKWLINHSFNRVEG